MLSAADQALVDAVVGPAGRAQRRAVAKAITLLESTRADHRAPCRRGVGRAAAGTPDGRSVWASPGAPGVGKSTFIEALGLR